jgi:hypothetical protein
VGGGALRQPERLGARVRAARLPARVAHCCAAQRQVQSVFSRARVDVSGHLTRLVAAQLTRLLVLNVAVFPPWPLYASASMLWALSFCANEFALPCCSADAAGTQAIVRLLADKAQQRQLLQQQQQKPQAGGGSQPGQQQQQQQGKSKKRA